MSNHVNNAKAPNTKKNCKCKRFKVPIWLPIVVIGLVAVLVFFPRHETTKEKSIYDNKAIVASLEKETVSLTDREAIQKAIQAKKNP